MQELILVLALVVTSLTIRKTGFLSPASIFNIVATASLITFYWFLVREAPKVILSGLTFRIRNYEDVALPVMSVYLLFVCLAGLSTLGLSQAPSLLAKKLANYYGGLAGSYYRNSMERYLGSPGATILYVVLVILYIWHFIDLDKELLWRNTEYLAINIPSKMGLDNSVTSLLHHATGPLGLATSCLTVYYWMTRRYLSFTLVTTLTVYFFVLKMAAFSRWAPLFLLVSMAFLMSNRLAARRFVFSWGSVLCLIGALWTYSVVGQGRSGQEQGISGVIGNEYNFDIEVLLSRLTVNVFNGALIFGEALYKATPSYPDTYKILSFSPLPSFLDDWREFTGSEARINRYTPFNTFAELYTFGPIYVFLFAVIFTISLRLLNTTYLRSGPFFGFLLTSPCTFVLLSVNQYPIRNCLRILVFTSIFTYLISRAAQKQALREPVETQGGALIPQAQLGKLP